MTETEKLDHMRKLRLDDHKQFMALKAERDALREWIRKLDASAEGIIKECRLTGAAVYKDTIRTPDVETYSMFSNVVSR